MYDYQLRVRKPTSVIGGTQYYEWLDIDLGDEQPAMNYQINALAELRHRNASYSQAVKLPKSSNNLRALGFIDQIDIKATEVYDPLRCELLCDGLPISPPGALLFIDRVGQTIDGQIVSAGYDFFKLLDELPMNQNAATGFTLPWTPSPKVVNGADGSFTLPNGIVGKYFYASTNKGGKGQSPGSPDWHNYYPHLPFLATVRELLRQKGYTLETDLTDESWIPCANPQMNPDGYTYTATAQADSVDLTGSIKAYPLNLVWGDETGESGRLAGSAGVWFKALEDCEVSFNEFFSAARTNTGSSIMQFGRNIIWNDASGNIKQTFRKMGGDPDGFENSSDAEFTVNNTYPASMKKGDYISAIMQFSILGSGASAQVVNSGIHFQILASNTDDTSPNPFTLLGAPLDLLASMGFKTCKEFILAFVQLYGVTIDIDDITKTVSAYTVDEWYRRKAQALDWTGKLTTDTPEQSFTISSYAQTNVIKFKDNGDDNVTDSASFAIANKTLDTTKDLFTLIFEAGLDIMPDPYVSHIYPTPDGNYANYPVFEVSEEEGVDAENWSRELAGSENPHIIKPASFPQSIAVPITQGYITPTVSMPIAQHLPARVRSYLNQFYGKIVNNLLTDARTVKVKLNLTVADIATLDLFTPVVLHGIYFYISKINNFVKGRPTTVDLIKM